MNLYTHQELRLRDILTGDDAEDVKRLDDMLDQALEIRAERKPLSKGSIYKIEPKAARRNARRDKALAACRIEPEWLAFIAANEHAWIDNPKAFWEVPKDLVTANSTDDPISRVVKCMAAIMLYEVRRQQSTLDMRAVAASLYGSWSVVNEAQALGILERMEDEGSRLFHLESALGRGAIFAISCSGTEILGKKDFRKTGPEFEQAVARFRDAGAAEVAARYLSLRDALAISVSPGLCHSISMLDDLPSIVYGESATGGFEWGRFWPHTDEYGLSHDWSLDQPT